MSTGYTCELLCSHIKGVNGRGQLSVHLYQLESDLNVDKFFSLFLAGTEEEPYYCSCNSLRSPS